MVIGKLVFLAPLLLPFLVGKPVAELIFKFFPVVAQDA
jgi:hypothetical protein